MDAGLSLASAGDNIKLWDCNGYSIVKEFNPHSDNVHSIAWSHDNTALASASTAGDKIVVSFVGADEYSITLSDKEARGRTCVAFCSSSRYIVGGGTDSIIYVWDMKTQKLKKEYKGLKGSVTTVQFNYNDTVIASGSESGEIMLYNVVTGIGYTPLTTPKSQTIRQLQYSYLKKTLLGSVSDDGVTYLWDTNSKRLLHSFSAVHKAPATGLAFSPLNDMLLLSVGLDKAIVCYDVRTKHIVKTMMCESALTSIDLLHDGSTVAVGSSRGRIYIYDLRHGATPIHVKLAHKTSVACLRFQKNLFVIEDGERGGHPVPSTVSSSLLAADANNSNNNTSASLRLNSSSSSLNVHEKTLSPNAASPAAADQGLNVVGQTFAAGEVFSPIRDTNISETNSSSVVVTTRSDAKYVPVSIDSAISPTVNGIHSVFSHASESIDGFDGSGNTTNNNNNNLSGLPAAVRLSETNLFSPPNNLDSLNRIDKANKTVSAASLSLSGATEHYSRLSQKSSSSPEAAKERGRSTDRTASRLTTPPDAAPSFEEGLAASASASSVGEEVPFEPVPSLTNASANSFQLEFIINAFRELLDDSQEQIRQDVLNLHVEMLKQFQIHKMECKKMLETYSVIPDLLAEIQRLREENAQLKKNY